MWLTSTGDTFIRIRYGLVVLSYSHTPMFAFGKYTITLHFKYTKFNCTVFEPAANL